MAIPTIEEILLPLLKRVSDKREHKIGDVIEALVADFGLSPAERKVLLPSGREPRFNNRVRWAKLHLKGAHIIEDATGGNFRITERGLKVLKENPEYLDFRYLMRFEEYLEYRGIERTPEITIPASEGSPDEEMAKAYLDMRTALAGELRDKLMSVSPSFFERSVADLVLAMGYGGSRDDIMQAVGGTRDGGIDGVIKVDKLGLDLVCIQAKRWKDTVGSATVQAFVGSLGAKKASKGILVTTSRFSDDAKIFADKTDKKVILIDGEKLTELMIEYNIGVTEKDHFVVKRIDLDYFEE